ncbi:LEAF RUST 10 DISEASE-RESISTANCE LOCUS RECEPTOR-LIKE PROTEIN KINASE-like 2.1 [Salvia divinorum]|uniref:non-specific serine/threonine protein kinase n=1 Tax=Salvia divinorum TaxID=28513 RepID=A0ABD1FJ66_SALDI
MNLHSFCLCILSLIILSKICGGAEYRYEACAPTNCGDGPNISYPFFLSYQQSHCGYPGFEINCSSSGFPLLQLSENEYVIEHIFYHNQSLHVFDAAALSSSSSSSSLSSSNCSERLGRNTTLPAGIFDYVGGDDFLLFSNCKNVTGELLRYQVACHSGADVVAFDLDDRRHASGPPNTSSGGITFSSPWSSVTTQKNRLAMYGGNGNLGRAADACVESVAVHAELNEDERGDEVVDVVAVLRRGFVMNWTAAAASDCSACQESGGRCGFDESSFRFRCFCPDRPHSRRCRPRKTRLSMFFFIGGPMAALTPCLIGVYVFIRRKRAKAKQAQEKDIERFLKSNGNLAPIRYKYSSIQKTTNSFHEKLGRGGFGNVYKGKFLDGRLVAVKVLNDSNGNGEDFMNEVASISRTSHVNIVALLGFCFEGSKRALIYDFMPNGSLEKFISNNASSSQGSSLGWEKLFEIALGIARGLEYLHQGCNTRILHLDIKPQNILLDEDMNPRISDFGLAKLCPNRSSIVSMVGARGTIGYIAPEVFSRNFGEVSYKSDVYSYGMLVLEMAGGRKTVDPRDVDRTSEIYFPDYLYKEVEVNAERDGNMSNEESESQPLKRHMIIIGLWCIQTNPKDRPTMTRVVEMLEGKLGSLEVPPKPYLFSSPRSAVPFYSTFKSF